jgi:hypothetical protein
VKQVDMGVSSELRHMFEVEFRLAESELFVVNGVIDLPHYSLTMTPSVAGNDVTGGNSGLAGGRFYSLLAAGSPEQKLAQLSVPQDRPLPPPHHLGLLGSSNHLCLKSTNQSIEN